MDNFLCSVFLKHVIFDPDPAVQPAAHPAALASCATSRADATLRGLSSIFCLLPTRQVSKLSAASATMWGGWAKIDMVVGLRLD